MDIQALRAAFAPKEKTNFSNKYYPFWKMNIGETATIRFLPDADTKNPYGFITENMTHTLYVNGQKKIVPCMEMYGDECPVCAHSRQLYDAKDELNGKRYYRKKEYLAQVLVINSPFEFDIGENPVKIVSLGPKLFKIIQAQFMSGDLDEVPCDLNLGYDFRINKSQQGDYADYTLSNFARKSTPVDPEIRPLLQLSNLSDQRTAAISREALNALLMADLTGGGAPEETAHTTSAEASAEINTTETAPSVATMTASPATAEVTTKKTAAQILAEIKARNAAKTAA
jgi:hypothetical protein